MSHNQPPPLSFKTVPGRHRTQKWNKAPSYNYDGDDWGGYDPYDEYGGQQEPEPMPPPPQPQHYAQQPAYPRGRKGSFDPGQESRQFSAPASSFAQSASSAGLPSNEYSRSRSRPRDFTNPEQVPPPLMTKQSPPPPPPTWFPPRKTSLGGNDVASQAQAEEARAIAATAGSPNTDKPLPFIRPSDIYKRIPDELRRQSEEGNRPSLEALQKETSPQRTALDPVQESRESRLFMDEGAPISFDSSLPNVTSDKATNFATRSQLPSLQPEVASPASQSSTNPVVPITGHTHTPSANRGDDAVLTNSGGISHDPTSFQNIPATATAPLDGQMTSVPHQYPPTSQEQSGLQHQPSQGFRSAVHQAFDHNTTTLSRDSSQSGPDGSGVSRSDTNSTTGISPIMSRVPSAATAQLERQQRMEEQVPPIAEEPSFAVPTTVGPTLGLQQGPGSIPRKPSPGRGRNMGDTPSDFAPGYRRSLDPPSNGTSPARLAGVENTTHKRLSDPMSAVPVGEADAPDVIDQAAEVPEPILRPAETPSEINSLTGVMKPLPGHSRVRSNTDYSVREADIADNVNSSPTNDMIGAAEAHRDSQKLFLETHSGTPTTPGRAGDTFATTGTPTRADSPTKGRVREIADRYHEIHQASRRNSAASVGSSKSSWSNFDEPRLRREGTSQSLLGVEAHGERGPSLSDRPELGRESSFQPELPGGWISATPTPALETPPLENQHNVSATHRTIPDEEVDLTPTTVKYQLPSTVHMTSTPEPSNRDPFNEVRNAGDQLGASLISNHGIGHQTRDFASSAPAPPVDQPELQTKPSLGAVAVQPPPLIRNETDSTDATASIASSVAPTPPAKDTPTHHDTLQHGAGYFNTVAPLRLRTREPSPDVNGISSQQPVTSTHGNNGSYVDNDSLRQEIVRSLGSPQQDSITREESLENAERTQDALDAPDNARRVADGESALPAAEAIPPRLLTTRFSWERDDSPALSTAPSLPVAAPEPQSPEIKPEMAYERPRDKALHVMNPGESPMEATPVQERAPTVGNALASHPLAVDSTAVAADAPSPITKSQEYLLPQMDLHASSPSHSMRDLEPSPISDNDALDSRLPSYYLGPHDGESQSAPPPPERDVAAETDASQEKGAIDEKDAIDEKGPVESSMSPVSPTAVNTQPKASGPIPPFRSILAMKSSTERIKTYNDTRHTFADMNTGLGDWLSTMLEQHPEHANLSTTNSSFKPPALQSSPSSFGGTFRRGHKASPSIAKFIGGDDKQRTASSGSVGESSNSTRPVGQNVGDGPMIDMDKMQQRGKNLMKQAGVFGGKAQEGAKGLFNKSKSRFGGVGGSVRKGSQVPPPSTSSSSVTVFHATTATTTSASPLNEVSTALDNVREGSQAPAEPTNGQPATTGLITDGPRPTLNADPVDQRTLTLQSETSTVPPPPYTTLDRIAPIAPPAEEAPSLTAFVSPTSDRPPLSRSTSYASGNRRPRSQTPSSAAGSNSRPVSQVFERLRNISRSSTRSGKRSRSRPTSLVLGNPDLLEQGNEDDVLQRLESDQSGDPELVPTSSSFSIMGVRSTEPRLDLWEEPTVKATPRRTESWNEPGAHIPPPKTPEERTGTLSRLGILPSPAPTATTFEDSAALRVSIEEAKERAAAFGLAEDRASIAQQAESMEPAEVQQQRPKAEITKEEQQDERPQPIRRESDLAILPSQRRDRGAESPPSPLPQDTSPISVRNISGFARLSSQQTDFDHSNPGQSPSHRSQRSRRISDLAILPSQRSDDEPASPEQSPPRPQRPPRPRKLSDIALLPSQRRFSPLDIGRPDSMTLAMMNLSSDESVAIEGEVHQANALSIEPISPAIVMSGRIKEGDDETTPIANKKANTPIASKAIEDDLYDSTPVARQPASKPWEQNMNQHDEDTRSEISAEHGALRDDESKVFDTASRRSSVSSLGDVEKDESQHHAEGQEPAIQPDQTGPTAQGPHTTATHLQPEHIPSALQGSTVAVARGLEQQSAGNDDQRLANRQYRPQRPGIGERPLSYMPLPRDAQGLPVAETISTGVEGPQPVDISGITGPPPGAPPFAQHPAVRNSGSVQPTQYERLRSSVINTPATQSSVEVGPGPLPGFFRGRSTQSDTQQQIQGPAPPPPSRISDLHGLEDVGFDAQHDVQKQRVERPPEQSRRRSGLWGGFGSRRSSNQRFDSSRESSVAPLDSSAAPPPSEAVASDERTSRQTLKKPQRAASTAVDQEPKKKRFSRLGSLFGRSSTSAGNSTSSKPSNRLSKAAPPPKTESSNAPTQARPTQMRQSQPPQLNSSSVAGNVRGYDAYEAAMSRRHSSAFQENRATIPTPPASAPVEPPSEGWYGPQQQSQTSEDYPSPPSEAPRPEFRRLHSDNRRTSGGAGGPGLVQVPESFRPVQSSFNRPVAPIGPPDGYEPPMIGSYQPRQAQYSGPLPTDTNPLYSHLPMEGVPYEQQLRNHSYGSDVSQITPPVSGRSEYYPPGGRPLGSLSIVPPVQSREQHYQQHHRVNSIPEETVARSPAREYADQQTPWAITLPRGERGPRQVPWDDQARQAPWPEQRAHGPPLQSPHGPPPQSPHGFPLQSPHGPPQSPHRQPLQSPHGLPLQPPHGLRLQSPHRQPPPLPRPQSLVLTAPQDVGFYPPPPRGAPRPPIWLEEQQSPPRQQLSTDPRPGTSPAHFYQSGIPPSNVAPPPPYQQNRYYTNGPRPDMMSPPPRRASQGFSGRRDDPTIGEEELIMRGVSYPGQEWAPRIDSY